MWHVRHEADVGVLLVDRDARGLDRLGNGGEVGRLALDGETAVFRNDVLCAGLKRDFHHLVFVDSVGSRDHHLSEAVEEAARGALLCELGAVLLEDVANFGGGAVLVVGENRDHERHRALDALVLGGHHFGGLELSRALLDGALDVVVRHLRRLRLRDERAERGVVGRIPALRLHDDRDFLAEFREDFALLRVRRAFRALDCCPVAVT